MIIEQHALWGDEPTPERPATYTAYLADRIPAQEQKLFPRRGGVRGRGLHPYC